MSIRTSSLQPVITLPRRCRICMIHTSIIAEQISTMRSWAADGVMIQSGAVLQSFCIHLF